jgi:hypothetical protein
VWVKPSVQRRRSKLWWSFLALQPLRERLRRGYVQAFIPTALWHVRTGLWTVWAQRVDGLLYGNLLPHVLHALRAVYRRCPSKPFWGSKAGPFEDCWVGWGLRFLVSTCGVTLVSLPCVPMACALGAGSRNKSTYTGQHGCVPCCSMYARASVHERPRSGVSWESKE